MCEWWKSEQTSPGTAKAVRLGKLGAFKTSPAGSPEPYWGQEGKQEAHWEMSTESQVKENGGLDHCDCGVRAVVQVVVKFGGGIRTSVGFEDESEGG